MQASLSAFDTRFAAEVVPYEVPHESGMPNQAREDHRSLYWHMHDYESYTCPDCGRGVDEVEGFDIHHIDRDPLNGALWNLIGVCRRCHGWRHGDRSDISGLSIDEWKQAFVDESYHPVY